MEHYLRWLFLSPHVLLHVSISGSYWNFIYSLPLRLSLFAVFVLSRFSDVTD